MRLEWLEDILAVLDQGTLGRAADARRLTQPAFSRRIRSIEEQLGVELIDRGRRPVRLRPVVLAHQDRMRELAAGLHELMRDLRRAESVQNRVVVASQHAITTSIAPNVLRNHVPESVSLRLRSANRDECHALIMTRQADLTLVYQTPADRFAGGEDLLEERPLGTERFIPVFATSELPQLLDRRSRHELPVILYPHDVFLGRHMQREVMARLPRTLTLVRRAETALTLASLQLALAGVGVAWVPHSLAARELASGSLADLSGWLPESSLGVAAFRLSLSERRSDLEEMVWASLVQLSALAPAADERV